MSWHAAGTYRIDASASEAGGELGRAEIQFQVGRENQEYDRLDMDEAVVRALESGEPSKQHVLNCLSRLQQPRRLQPLKPPLVLTLVTEPLADTARYDQLRSTHHEG